MTQEKENNLLASLMQMVNENGLEAVAETFRILLNEAMKIERDQSLGAGLYERTDNRQGYANGYKPKSVDTRMGRLMVNVPQVRGGLPKRKSVEISYSSDVCPGCFNPPSNRCFGKDVRVKCFQHTSKQGCSNAR